MHLVVFFCNFSTVQKCCHLCNNTKAQQNEKIPKSHFTFRTKNAYDDNIIAINEDPSLSHLYGMVSKRTLF